MKLSKNNLFVKAWQFAEGNPYSYPTNWCSLTWKGVAGIVLFLVTAIPGLFYYAIAYIGAYFDKGFSKPTWYNMYCKPALWGVGLIHLFVASIPVMIMVDEGKISTFHEAVWTAIQAFFCIPIVLAVILAVGYLVFDALPEKLRNRESKVGQGLKAVGHGLKKLKDDHCPLIEWEEEE